jgi:hypothetical protein
VIATRVRRETRIGGGLVNELAKKSRRTCGPPASGLAFRIALAALTLVGVACGEADTESDAADAVQAMASPGVGRDTSELGMPVVALVDRPVEPEALMAFLPETFGNLDRAVARPLTEESSTGAEAEYGSPVLWTLPGVETIQPMEGPDGGLTAGKSAASLGIAPVWITIWDHGASEQQLNYYRLISTEFELEEDGELTRHTRFRGYPTAEGETRSEDQVESTLQIVVAGRYLVDIVGHTTPLAQLREAAVCIDLDGLAALDATGAEVQAPAMASTRSVDCGGVVLVSSVPGVIAVLPEACSLYSEEEATDRLGSPATASQAYHGAKERSECHYTASEGGRISIQAMFVMDEYYDPSTFREFVEAMGMPVTGPADVVGGAQAYYGEQGEMVAVMVASSIRGTAMLSDRPVSRLVLGVAISSRRDRGERLEVAEEIAATVLERLGREGLAAPETAR